ncbi:winged helix-turn-helix domain-containing protein [Candidatus Acetothermia bacterium]|nr:winged helix-turn-helix domain-containing protein [Candidatus Acetothermia bacterium]
MELAQAYGESNRYGKHIAVPMKGAEMARLAGINPTTFSQCLIRFEDRGWIRRSGGEIWVCQEVALRGIVEC